MDIISLAQKLNIPEEVVFRLQPVSEAAPYLQGLCSAEYERAAAGLHEALGADEGGYKILSAMLEAALLSRQEYARRGISEDVYFATMGCFPRFIREHKESFGFYGFDRWWWTGHQTSLMLFRLGALEYELCTDGGKKFVSIHIPSDADLSSDAVDASLLSAAAFVKKFFPEYAGGEFECKSWLLSPSLGELLPSDSNINRFRTRFEILEFNEEANDCMIWVFKNASLSKEELPENTTLQRNMKAFLLRGGKVGAARGVIRRTREQE